MGTFTNLGWSTSSDEIPESISIVLGSNLRKNSDRVSKQQKPVQGKTAPQAGREINLQHRLPPLMPVIEGLIGRLLYNGA
jgi:hypothetical protein